MIAARNEGGEEREPTRTRRSKEEPWDDDGLDGNSDGITIMTRRFSITYANMAALGTGIVAMVTGIVYVTLLWSSINTSLNTQKENSDRDRITMNEMRQTIDTITKDIGALRELLNVKHQQLNDIVMLQGSRIDALSANARVQETAMSDLRGNLTTAVRDEAKASQQIFEKLSDLGTALARVEARMGFSNPETRPGLTHP